MLFRGYRMKINIKLLLTVNLAIPFYFSCASARVVKYKPGKGGIIALHPGLDGDGRSKAFSLMDTNCNRGYDIIEEGEAKIGENKSSYNDSDILLGKGSTEESRQATEWRIKYKCRGNGKKLRKSR